MNFPHTFVLNFDGFQSQRVIYDWNVDSVKNAVTLNHLKSAGADYQVQSS